MGSSFNAQVLAEKLSKLNSSQASIETLSHWCIFHMNKAKHVVETWGRQFHCSPREQRLAYLYLANDILQNSRRRGAEFVGEFWNVLPEALRDVVQNGDDSERKSALRLVNIWEERKVFGSSGQILKEEILRKLPENGTRNVALVPLKLKQATPLEKVVSAVEAIHGVQIDEHDIVGKCTNVVGYLEKVAQEVESNLSAGHTPGPAVVNEVQGQHTILRDCIEQLVAMETSRTSLISHLREALQEQELKLEQVRNHLQTARLQSDRTGDLCKQFLDHGSSSQAPATGEEEVTKVSVTASAPVMFASNPPTQSVVVDPRKTEAAAMVAKLTASTSSAEMLSYVLSSFASEGIIGNNPPPVTETPPEKRPKLQNLDQSYPQQNTSTATTSPPPPPPPPAAFQLQPQFLQPLQPPGPVNSTPFSYSIATTQQQQQQQQGPWIPGLTSLPTTSVPSDSSYQNYQGQDGFYGTTNSPSSMTPVTRQ
ncbi:RNA polymerase II-binding domain-containing protein [Hirschfeldia incana]|nr:RNA polymerase II-binding domain-containing protein [Hirschfeldia incana]